MIKVNESLCTHCGLCARICPFTVLEMRQGHPAVRERKEKACIKCMHCVSICPVSALTFENIPACSEKSLIPAENSYEILKGLISGNRSIRHFSDKPVSLDEIREILDAAKYAPSAKNQHPNQWILVHDTNKVREILSCVHKYVEEHNVSKEILSEYKIGNDVVTLSAPHILYGVAPKDAINPYTDTTIALTDVDLLMHAKSIGACWAGYLTRLTNANPIIREILGLDDSMQVYGALAFGYPKGEKYERLPHRNAAEIKIL